MENESEELIEGLKQAWRSESDLSALRELPLPALRLVHTEVLAHQERTHEGQRRLFEGLAKATRLLPNFFVVKTSSSLTPLVLAGVTEYLEPKLAAQIAKHLDPQVLGEVVLHLRASTAARVAQHQDPEVIGRIIDYLHAKGFVKRLGELSDALEEPLLAELVRRMPDATRIAAIASHMQQLDKVRSVSRRLDRSMLMRVRQLLEHHGQHRTLAAMS